MSDSSPAIADPVPPSSTAPSSFERLNRWLVLAANLGVLAGLIVLTVEIRQNAELTRADMESRKNDVLVQIELSLADPEIGAAWIKSVRSPETMTDLELRAVESHLVALMLQWDYMFNMEQGGLVSRDEARRHIQNTAPFYFGSRHAKNWWRWQEAGWEGTPMFEIADPIVRALDDNFMADYLDGTRLGPATTPATAHPGTDPDAPRSSASRP